MFPLFTLQLFCKLLEDAPFDQGNTRTTQTAGVGSSASKKNEQTKKQESQNSNDRSSQANLFYARNTPGCYCHHNYYQQTSVGDWSPKQINGIVIQRGNLDDTIKIYSKPLQPGSQGFLFFVGDYYSWNTTYEQGKSPRNEVETTDIH